MLSFARLCALLTLGFLDVVHGAHAQLPDGHALSKVTRARYATFPERERKPALREAQKIARAARAARVLEVPPASGDSEGSSGDNSAADDALADNTVADNGTANNSTTSSTPTSNALPSTTPTTNVSTSNNSVTPGLSEFSAIGDVWIQNDQIPHAATVLRHALEIVELRERQRIALGKNSFWPFPLLFQASN